MIPVSKPLIVGNEKKYLNECIDSGWLGCRGPFVERFEAACAQKFHRKHAMAVSSGTAALQLALVALGVGEADEVIVPVFSYAACPFAVSYLGARPMFVDCDPRTYNIDPAQIEAKITRRTKAIMLVHTYGLPADIIAIKDIAKRHELPIIEDAAEAIGAYYHDWPCGSFGDISIFSFYGNKNVACGEGGMVLTNREDLRAELTVLNSMGQDPYRRYRHTRIGYNYRMSNMQAAVGLAQLENLDMVIDRKSFIASWYDGMLAGLPLQFPVDGKPEGGWNTYWVYPVLTPPGETERVADELLVRGIETRPFFWPNHMHDPYKLAYYDARFPVAEQIAGRGIYLPSGPELNLEAQWKVIEALKEIL